MTRRLLIMLVIVGSLLASLPTNAQALTGVEPLVKDFQVIDGNPSALSSGAAFDALSGTEQQAFEQGLAYLNWQESVYGGNDITSSWTGLDSAAQERVEEFTKSITKGVNATADGGTVEEAIGGEAMDAAATSGLFSLAALIPIAATLTYDDITTGTNPVTVAIFGSKEDHERLVATETGLEEAKAAENLRWLYIPEISTSVEGGLGAGIQKYEGEHSRCAGHAHVFLGDPETCHEAEAFNAQGMPMTTWDGTNVRPGRVCPTGSSGRQYYLTFEVGGTWYDCSVDLRSPEGLEHATIAGTEFYGTTYRTAVKAELKGWVPVTVGHTEGCGYGGPNLAGWPSEVGPFILFHQEAEFGEHCAGGEREYSTAVVRAPSRFHMGLPRGSSTGGVEALEGAGHSVEHLSGHKIEGTGGLTTHEAATEQQKIREEGGNKVEEEAMKHWLEETPVEHGAPKGVPEVPLPGTVEIPKIVGNELYTTYKAALEASGFTNISEHILSEVATDPAVGPNDVSSTVPKDGTRTETTTKINVNVNPEDAPEVEEKEKTEGGGETGGGIGPPTLPGIHPPNLHLLCTTMPFGVPCWLILQLKEFQGAKTTPVWTVGPITVLGRKLEATISLAPLEPIMEIVRPFMILFSTVGLMLFFYRIFTGKSMSGGENPPEPAAWETAGETSNEDQLARWNEGGMSYGEEQGSFMRDG